VDSVLSSWFDIARNCGQLYAPLLGVVRMLPRDIANNFAPSVFRILQPLLLEWSDSKVTAAETGVGVRVLGSFSCTKIGSQVLNFLGALLVKTSKVEANVGSSLILEAFFPYLFGVCRPRDLQDEAYLLLSTTDLARDEDTVVEIQIMGKCILKLGKQYLLDQDEDVARRMQAALKWFKGTVSSKIASLTPQFSLSIGWTVSLSIVWVFIRQYDLGVVRAARMSLLVCAKKHHFER